MRAWPFAQFVLTKFAARTLREDGASVGIQSNRWLKASARRFDFAIEKTRAFFNPALHELADVVYRDFLHSRVAFFDPSPRRLQLLVGFTFGRGKRQQLPPAVFMRLHVIHRAAFFAKLLQRGARRFA